jgi:hypothetical protein
VLLVDLLSYGFHIELSFGEVPLEAERAQFSGGRAKLPPIFDRTTNVQTATLPARPPATR